MRKEFRFTNIFLCGRPFGGLSGPEDYSGFSNQLGLPIIVKPNDAGSSVEISRVECLEDLKPAVQKALQYSQSVLLEEYIPGKELTVTIIDSGAYPVVEIKPLEGWYDYTNKYTHGNKIRSSCSN